VEEVVDETVKTGGRAKTFIEDVAKKVGAQNLINQVEDRFGHIDALINHASVAPNVSVLEMDEWDWHRVLDVNMTGVFLMTQSVGRLMRGQGSGVIINLIGMNQESVKKEAAFISSMEGIRGFTKHAARELNPLGIQVHAVETGDAVVERVLRLLESK
jgi:NAD(P)-dependent dehydrogenase (short-subunit alcohol dehydrogenase family)